MQLYILLIELVLAVFMLRFLMQSSSADYYHPFTQMVVKLTSFAVNLPVLKSFRAGPLHLAGLFVAYVISLVFWLLFGPAVGIPIPYCLLVSFVMFIKTFGYLLVILLVVQALCSWLEATRHVSLYIGQITSVIVAPVQRVVPPIGMIDISLMLILIVLFLLNGLFARALGTWWLIV